MVLITWLANVVLVVLGYGLLQVGRPRAMGDGGGTNVWLSWLSSLLVSVSGYSGPKILDISSPYVT
jgi:hypothetical protein